MPIKKERQRGGLARWAGGVLLVLAAGGIEAQPLPGTGPDSAGQVARQVMDLSRAWRLALENDHRYRAALSEQAASQTERALGRAELRPQVQAGYYRSRVTGNTTQRDLGPTVGTTLDYDSLNAYVQVQQPLLSPIRYARYQRGHARA